MNYFLGLIITLAFQFYSTQDIPFEKIESAFNNANAEALVEVSKSKLLLNIDGVEGVYSKAQSIQIFKTFFNTNPPETFSISFKSSEKQSGTFALGNYVSNKQEVFKIKMKFLNENTNYLIESMVIQKQ